MAKTSANSEEELFRQAVIQLKIEGIIDPNVPKTLNEFHKQFAQFASDFPVIQGRMESLGKTYHRFSDDVENTIDKMNKQKQAFGHLSDAVRSVAAPVQKVSGMFTSFGAVFGGTSLGISNSIQNLNKYNIELRATSSQFTKYGQGISQTKQQVEGLAEQFKWTREQTLSLMSSFESGFDLADIEAMPSLFDSISDSVGGGADQVGKMMQAIQAIGSKSLGFQDLIMKNFADSSVSVAEKMNRIKSAGLSLIAGGKISVSEAKKLDEIARGGTGLSKEDEEQKKNMDEQMKFFRSMNKLFEDISQAIGSEIMPYAQKIGNFLLSIKETLIPIVKWTVIIGTSLSLFAGFIGSFRGLLSIGLSLKQAAQMGNFAATGLNTGGAITGLGRAASSMLLPSQGLAGLGTTGGIMGAGLAGLAGYGAGSGSMWVAEKMMGLKKGESVMENNKVIGYGASIGGGAAAGAIIGSVIPIIGTAVGAVIGGIGGAVAAWFESDKSEKAVAERLETERVANFTNKDRALEIQQLTAKDPDEKRRIDFERDVKNPLDR